jgi:predicted house-cleaning noncanonical NTP pyrophosphatase (MazG superfamily)
LTEKLIRARMYDADFEWRDPEAKKRARIVADVDEHLRLLYDKLDEEVAELRNAKNPEHVLEELGDVAEVLRGIARVQLNMSGADIERQREHKYIERGGFVPGRVWQVDPGE